MLADEPTSALDAANTERFLTLLQDMMEKSRQTLMVVSHDRHIQSYFDDVIEIEQLLAGGRGIMGMSVSRLLMRSMLDRWFSLGLIVFSMALAVGLF